MKKHLFLIALLLVVIMCLTSCAIIDASWEAREKEYYSDKNNFEECCVAITDIQQSDEGKIYITVEQPEGFSDVCFKLDSASSEIAKDNGFITEVKVGDEIIFMSAPRYFGDGYVYPVVSLSKGDKVYLSFDVGYENLMKEYE